MRLDSIKMHDETVKKKNHLTLLIHEISPQLTAKPVLQSAYLSGWSKKHIMRITIIVLKCLSVVSDFRYDTATIEQFWI